MRYFCLIFMSFLFGCGGGGGGGAPAPASTPVSSNVAPGTNVVSLYAATVNVNILLASVTVCTPNTSNCQVIPNLLVDTGSYGIRILKSALSVPLTQVTGSGGNPLAECAPFASGYTWGPVEAADIAIGGEKAYGIPIQVIDDSQSPNPAVPASCSSTSISIGSAAALNANGVLGVGVFTNDCGASCTAANNGVYFECPATGCASLGEPASFQVKNPVTQFALDNNGLVIVLPQLPPSGASSLSGSMIFGIGTRSNNALGQANVLMLDGSGNLTTVFNGQALTSSFLDSGSNMLFFQDGTTPACKIVIGGYCPSSTQQFSATLQAANSPTPSVSVSFSVANGDALVSTGNNILFNNIAGSPTAPGTFDWGLPFFFGRSVFFAVSGSMTPAGPGPFVAF